MALFVLGAGATRGASFVDASANVCLPPLDTDFYAQMQRIQHAKHAQIIDSVITDTVELFGVNFQVTMESVFTTLEHTSRMIETTGENRDFRKSDLEAKKERLKQAIAATLEESLCNGGGQHEGVPCDNHRQMVEKMRPGDHIVTFNYDCLIDETLRAHGNGKWNARYGYRLSLGRGRANLSGEDHWNCDAPPPQRNRTISLYKMHGSLHFDVTGERVRLKRRPYTRQNGNLRFTIIPPESNKRYDQGVFKRIWKEAGQALHRSRNLIVIGYSFPETDSHANALFRISTRRESLDTLVIVNPDRQARRRAREVLKRAIAPSTRVIVFDLLKEFVAAPRELWA